HWTSGGMAVPAAPILGNLGAEEPSCASPPSPRPPETPEDNAVMNSGWTLFGSYQSGWGTKVIGAMVVGRDVQCPLPYYQYFVFAGGQFAGTVSPIAMAYRYDGAAGPPSLGDG